MLSELKTRLRSLKHVGGWRSPRRYVAFAVDDYGSIRSESAKAVERLRVMNPHFGGQMDELDAVETREDLEALYEVLGKHKDSQGRPAVFTAYALPANPDLERMRRERTYGYELLIQTFERLSGLNPKAYEGAWRLWEEGMEAGLICPQFHGREHFNIPILQTLLNQDNSYLDASLEVNSLAGLPGVPEVPNAGYTEAFVYPDDASLDEQRDIIRDGLRLFKEVFGFHSTTFAPPGLKLDKRLDRFAAEHGVKAIDRPFFSAQPARSGTTKRAIERLRPPAEGQCGVIVRSLSFEPGSGAKSDPVGSALKEVQVAFNWGSPAIIASHRVNYAGHIAPHNRRAGLESLDEFLRRLRKAWPDLEFVTLPELVDAMESTSASKSH